MEEADAMLRPPSVSDNSEDDGDVNGAEEEWAGIADPEPPPIDHEAEYIDEDKYTTVTVETMDVSREGLLKAQQGEDQLKQGTHGEAGDLDIDAEIPSRKKRKWTKEKPNNRLDKPRKKRRNFRYESRAERKLTRSKERSKNRKQAQVRRNE